MPEILLLTALQLSTESTSCLDRDLMVTVFITLLFSLNINKPRVIEPADNPGTNCRLGFLCKKNFVGLYQKMSIKISLRQRQNIAKKIV